MDDWWFPLILFLHWFGALCIVVVLGQIANQARICFKTWRKERLRYKLPKPPDAYRLN